ncbi:MAG: HD domain-containing protein [Stellaceae bacterium]
MAAEAELTQLRARLAEKTNGLAKYVFDVLAPSLIPTGSQPLAAGVEKVINDPIWKIFTLNQSVLPLIDLPVMQRLRRVRQLGLVHLVYPGTHHSRFEHSLGAMCAAAQMFDALALSAKMEQNFSRRTRNVVLAAAILHDTGHPVFSHVGERVLQRALRDEFDAIEAILREAFPDELEQGKASGQAEARRTKLPPAAELVSALITLSPALEQTIIRLNLEIAPHEAVMMICGLILGRPRKTLIDRDTYYHCLKGIISGDLDCDKVDYVARDAYYAGIPTATDIDRLLSQLVAVEVRVDTNAPELEYPFGGGNPDVIRLFGIRPAIASALEMFVMTRSYLFERLYAHPKVRAAERLLQRLLAQRVQFGREVQGWGLPQIFDFLYAPGGDDHVLGLLASEKSLEEAGDHFAQLARRILDRQLPMRALAISAATMTESAPRGDAIETAEFMPWQAAEDELSQNTHGLETRICQLTGLTVGQDIIVDWPLGNPIREDPDIWVSDPADASSVKRVSSYFNVEQLSNAYRSTKQVAWVFADPAQVPQVAAASAIALQEAYDLVAHQEAFNRAKVGRRAIATFFDEIRKRDDASLTAVVNNLTSSSADARTMRPTPSMIARALQKLEATERTEASSRIAGQIANAGLSRSFYDHLFIANQVLTILLNHCHTYYRHRDFADSMAPRNEAHFQSHLKAFCEHDERCQNLFELREAEKAGGGNVDLVFSWKRRESVYPDVVVELKSELIDFTSQYDTHAGQPFQYTGRNFGRVSLLYVQFRSEASVRIGDTLQARKNQHEASPQVVLCLAQQAFAARPHEGGKTSAPLTADGPGAAPAQSDRDK